MPALCNRTVCMNHQWHLQQTHLSMEPFIARRSPQSLFPCNLSNTTCKASDHKWPSSSDLWWNRVTVSIILFPALQKNLNANVAFQMVLEIWFLWLCISGWCFFS